MTRMLSDTQFVSRDTFKVVNGTWRYCLNGKYYPFFSDSMFKKGEMTKVYYNQIRNTDSFYSCSGYLPYKIEKINNKDVYVFKVSFGSCVTGVFNNIDIAYFYFDPSFGFIKKQFWNFAVRDVTILKER
ncbi:MAG: hypothetical protein NTW29_18040 [Bacteroidetes bacterium]|nr:hypothetical protein [Bacteroidota bacterium]